MPNNTTRAAIAILVVEAGCLAMCMSQDPTIHLRSITKSNPAYSGANKEMSDRIYLVSDGEVLTPMEDAPYAKEEVLQQLLERYPDLLAGEQITPDDPRRWLLIKREANITHDGGKVHRWRVDHLFLDQDAIPTLVETKIATNPELRRKVVGQMLDYASNLVEDWSVERIQSEFQSRCLESGVQEDQVLEEFLTGDLPSISQTTEQYWSDLKSNLETGRIRLLLVADRIPSSLIRIVDFLNSQMHPCEILAVELRQYLHPGHEETIRTLVPRVHGRVEVAREQHNRSRESNDPGMYILESIADEFEIAFGMKPRIRMHRRGWIRMDHPGGPEEQEWLIYQDRNGGTLNILYDGGHLGCEESERDRILSSIDKAALPGTVSLDHGYSDVRARSWFKAVIPGFVFDDSTHWEELQETLKVTMNVLMHADW